MSTTAILNVDNSIKYTIRTTDNNLSSSVQYKNIYSSELQSGSGVINQSFFTYGFLNSGTTQRFDTINLTGSGVTGSVNFSGGYIKLLLIENTTTSGDGYIVSNYDINLYGTGVAGLIQPFSSGYLKQTIPIDSFKIFYNPNSGYPISTGERYFYLNGGPVSGGTTFNMTILGYI